MRVIKDQTLYQLTLMPRIFPVNCYLVEEEDNLTLIDAALSSAAKPIQEIIQKIGKPLKQIVLTHAHGDHVGALDQLKEAYPNAQVMISKRDARLLRGDVSLNDDEPQTPIKGDIPKKLKTREDIQLEEGDSIGSLVAIATPGHTPGSMSFLDTRTKQLIAGDALYGGQSSSNRYSLSRGLSTLYVSGDMNWGFPFPAWATWNKEAALQSAKKLFDMDIACLAVGHGDLHQAPKEKMRRAINHLENTLI